MTEARDPVGFRLRGSDDKLVCADANYFCLLLDKAGFRLSPE
jgi:hypothetical protein